MFVELRFLTYMISDTLLINTQTNNNYNEDQDTKEPSGEIAQLLRELLREVRGVKTEIAQIKNERYSTYVNPKIEEPIKNSVVACSAQRDYRPGVFDPSLASSVSKHESRQLVANDIMSRDDTNGRFIHYLGGCLPDTPFEDLFTKDRVKNIFARYERKKCARPHHYFQEPPIYDSTLKTPVYGFPSSYRGIFVNYNFFSMFNLVDFSKAVEPSTRRTRSYFWLDFCNAPQPEIIRKVKTLIFDAANPYTAPSDSPFGEHSRKFAPFTAMDLGALYMTFYMNYRGYSFANEVFGNANTHEERSRGLTKYLSTVFTDCVCSAIHNYTNGRSNMSVFKIERSKK